MRSVIWAAVAAVCLFQAAHADEQKVSPEFSVLDYNRLANEHQPVATWVSFKTTKKIGDIMIIEYDAFGIGEYGNDTFFMTFKRSEIPTYRAHIAKFLQWEELASRDGDQFQKNIGRAAGDHGKIDFSFNSVAAGKHLLFLQYCSGGMMTVCSGEGPKFDRDGALGLDAMLAQLEVDGVRAVDIDEKYK